MMNTLKQNVIQSLWESYCNNTSQMRQIRNSLHQKGVQTIYLDHFAIIDLPGPHTGIPFLANLFTKLGYLEKGKDYLPSKQNDFLWMSEIDCDHEPAKKTLPQVVVADFRMDELPIEVKKIIEKYANMAPSDTLTILENYLDNKDVSIQEKTKLIAEYLSGRDWALPTTSEYYTVQAFNELLAWVLIFGRRPNHFTLSVHLLDHFKHLEHFNQFIEEELSLSLNEDGGRIKGGKEAGIAQSSTDGIVQTVQLADGSITVPTGFVEFVWRYPAHKTQTNPTKWSDYFTGFIANHANHVIESLYTT